MVGRLERVLIFLHKIDTFLPKWMELVLVLLISNILGVSYLHFCNPKLAQEVVSTVLLVYNVAAVVYFFSLNVKVNVRERSIEVRRDKNRD